MDIEYYGSELSIVIKFTFNNFYCSLTQENYKELIEFLKGELDELIVPSNNNIMHDLIVSIVEKMDNYDKLLDHIKLFNLLNDKLELMIPINKISDISSNGTKFNVIKLSEIQDIINNPFNNQHNKYINFLKNVEHEICCYFGLFDYA